MVNFLTDEFFKEDRVNNFLFIGALITIILIAFISNIYLKLYLENKELELKQEAIKRELSELDSSLLKIKELKEKKSIIEDKLFENNKFLAKMLPTTTIFEELNLLYSDKLYLQNFRLKDNSFELVGVSTDVMYLNKLNKRLESSDFFEEFYLEEIDKLDGRIKFKIRGTL